MGGKNTGVVWHRETHKREWEGAVNEKSQNRRVSGIVTRGIGRGEIARRDGVRVVEENGDHRSNGM
jgi:hypothetical protein